MAKAKKLSFTMRYVLVSGVLLLAANILLGIVVLNQSAAAMRSLIGKNMLDVVNCASSMLNGDKLNALTAEDVGGTIYNEICRQLTFFLNNDDIRFIYVVRPVGEGRFAFIVDPDPEAPAEFGEEIVITQGLLTAGTGTASVDDAPMADRWGNFYSAYSPVRDSEGGIAGIVGIDFDADWYAQLVREHTLSITIVTILSASIGGLIVFLITRRVRRQLGELSVGLSSLSKNVDRLLVEIETHSGYEPAPESRNTSPDELEALTEKIDDMQKGIRRYLDYLQEKAYFDALTKVRSATSYHELIQRLNADIAGGRARFCVAVFDVNSLKEINDNHGHEAGDSVIVGAAEAISSVFGPDNTYRIGGDEFVVVDEGLTVEEMGERLRQVEAQIRRFNASQKGTRPTLAVSMGLSEYLPQEDVDYRTVFARADQQMYIDKREYYQTTGNRRRSDR